MQVVFDTLQHSGIDFCVVQRDAEHHGGIIIDNHGHFTEDEKGEILTEVVGRYLDNTAFNQITMECE
jgi:hypothetical protein